MPGVCDNEVGEKSNATLIRMPVQCRCQFIVAEIWAFTALQNPYKYVFHNVQLHVWYFTKTCNNLILLKNLGKLIDEPCSLVSEFLFLNLQHLSSLVLSLHEKLLLPVPCLFFLFPLLGQSLQLQGTLSTQSVKVRKSSESIFKAILISQYWNATCI